MARYVINIITYWELWDSIGNGSAEDSTCQNSDEQLHIGRLGFWYELVGGSVFVVVGDPSSCCEEGMQPFIDDLLLGGDIAQTEHCQAFSLSQAGKHPMCGVSVNSSTRPHLQKELWPDRGRA